MHIDHNIDEFKPPFTEENMRNNRIGNRDDSTPLSPAHIAALSTCLTSIDGVFEAFLSLEIDVIRNLPVVIFVRTAYAVVVLIKMYFAASAPNSELGKVRSYCITCLLSSLLICSDCFRLSIKTT